MNTRLRSGLTKFEIWRGPALLGAACTVGLFAALLADGFWDVLSWVTLALPLGVTGWFTLRARKGT